MLNLNKPDLKTIFKNMLFAENYTLPDDTAMMIDKYLEVFEQTKLKKLYDGKKSNESLQSELSLSNLRQAFKLAYLLKNQEMAAYAKKLIERETPDETKGFDWKERYGMVFVLRDAMQRSGKTEYKTQDDYLKEREAKKVRHSKFMETKYKIEIDSLKEGLRVIIRNRVVKEWIEARQE